MKPKRIQRKRIKSWKMPPNTKYVGRPIIWGNPFKVGKDVTPQQAVERYALHLSSYFGWRDREIKKVFYPWPVKSKELEDWIKPLRGKNLACFCPLNQKCHADVLLELANK